MSEFEGSSGAILHRLERLHPRLIDLSLDRLDALLEKLGRPERHLSPVIHVAGTNGKGSTCANMRAIAEAAGLRVHVMTSPHLLALTERFRLAGALVDKDVLNEALEEIERVNDGAPITVFEVLTAAGFLLFSRTPADLTILEVGLGGRFDATNLVSPALVRACAIASISLDHQSFLGDTLREIAFEKAGIVKHGVPVVSAPQKPEAAAEIARAATDLGAPLLKLGVDVRWRDLPDGGMAYEDSFGTLTLPAPGLAGKHQRENAALAVATLRASGLALPEAAFGAIADVSWPGRLQNLTGSLAALLPPGWSLWVDGAHNPGGAEALAEQLRDWKTQGQPVHLVLGLKNTKDVSGFLAPLLPLAKSVQAVAEPKQHLAMPLPDILRAASATAPHASVTEGPTLRAALKKLANTASPLPAPARVVICGSLYLAACALEQDKG